MSEEVIDQMNEELRLRCVKFMQAFNELEETMGPITGLYKQMNMQQMMRCYDTLKWLKDMADQVGKYFTRDSKELQRLLHEMLEDAGFEKINFEGNAYSPIIKNRYNVPKNQKAEFIRWMKENHPDLVSEEVHHKSLESYCNARLEQGEELPPHINHYPEMAISVRKSR